jgi:hypothetical protein
MPLAASDETEAYTVGWDPELEAAVLEWHTTPDGQSFRAGQESLLSLVEERAATKVLADCRAFESFPDQTAWLRDDWLPRFLSSSVTHGAFVYPADQMARFELDKIAREDIDSPLEQLFAEERSEARAWLRIE